MKKILILVLVAWVCSHSLHGQTLEFSKENVVFQLDSVHFLVTADLFLKNTTNQSSTQTLFFPYSCEGHIIKVDSVSIFDANLNVNIKPARRNQAGVLFSLLFSPQEIKKVKIIYSQDHDGRLAGYVITKVKYWQGHLDQANYTLNVNSPSIVIDSTAYKPNQTINENGKDLYKWNKTNFKPEKEFCIYFHLKK